eukprot:sb/3465788/
MFSLRSLVDKVSELKSEISDRLAITPSPDELHQNIPDTMMDPGDDGADLFVGADLLHKYQETWEDIHRTTMTQSTTAITTADKITTLHMWLNHQNTLITTLTSSLEDIPRLAGVLDSCVGVVRETGLNISSLIVELDKLEADCDKLHTERLKSVHRFHLNSYREERLRELNQRKTLMEKSHHESLKVKALKECMAMTERQSTFGDLFAEEMLDYKRTGSLPVRYQQQQEPTKPDSGDLQAGGVGNTLDSFIPEGDQTDLADFLGSSTTTDQLSSLTEEVEEEVQESREQEDRGERNNKEEDRSERIEGDRCEKIEESREQEDTSKEVVGGEESGSDQFEDCESLGEQKQEREENSESDRKPVDPEQTIDMTN